MKLVARWAQVAASEVRIWPARRRCVDVFRERVQLDTSLTEQSRGIEQLPDGTGEPVQFPNNHDITFVCKADLCRRGSKATKEFCRNHRIPFETCGKLLVATNELELQRMNNLVERAKLNQIEVERLDAADLRQREPNIIGVGGLFVPETGIVDFKRVCEGMAGVVRKAGATIELGVTVTAISESDSAVRYQPADGNGRPTS